MIKLEESKHIYGFDRGLRSSLKNMQNIEIKIPIFPNGYFDIKAQEEIIEKYNLINDLKSKFVEYKQTIKNLKVI